MGPDNMPRPFAPESAVIEGKIEIVKRLLGTYNHDPAHEEIFTALCAVIEEIERLRSALRYEQNRSDRIGTHGPNCYAWGPAHWECAMGEIERLQTENAALRDVASEAELNREGIKHAHAELRRLRERIEKAPRVCLMDDPDRYVVSVYGRDAPMMERLIGKNARLVVEEG